MSSDDEAEITCRQFVELVTEYLEGALSATRRAELHAHLDECGGCSAYLEQMRATIAGLRGLAETGDLPEARVAALAAFREFHRDAAGS